MFRFFSFLLFLSIKFPSWTQAYDLPSGGSVLEFNRHCSSRPIALMPYGVEHLEPFSLDPKYDTYWQSFIQFEKRSGSSEGLGLGIVKVGWTHYDRNYRHISFELLKVHMDGGLQNWARDKVSLNLRMENTRTGESILATPRDGFQYGGPLPREKISYQVSDMGDFSWEFLSVIGKENALGRVHPQVRPFLESFERDPRFRGDGTIYSTFPVDFSLPEFEIPHPEDPHTLFLVVKNLANNETIQLEGPTLTSLPALWEQTFSIQELDTDEPPYIADIDPLGGELGLSLEEWILLQDECEMFGSLPALPVEIK